MSNNIIWTLYSNYDDRLKRIAREGVLALNCSIKDAFNSPETEDIFNLTEVCFPIQLKMCVFLCEK